MDRGLVEAWDSDEGFDELLDLGAEATRIPVGGGFAGIIGDGSVNDEGWIEVFQSSGRDRLAVLQVNGEPYGRALKDAVAYPTDVDAHGGTVTLPAANWRCSAPRSTPSGTTACRWPGRRPGRRPGPTWRTPLADEAVFARWLLLP